MTSKKMSVERYQLPFFVDATAIVPAAATTTRPDMIPIG